MVVSLACRKPKDLGYAQKLWTTRLPAEHVRNHCEAAGHRSLAKLGRGTVSKILRANQVQPHKIRYYLERRDPDFDAKMVQILHVYKQVEIWREKGTAPPDLVAVLSYDEKPGIQALENTAPDLPPVPENTPPWGATMSTSGTERCLCWPASTFCRARYSDSCARGIAVRSSLNS